MLENDPPPGTEVRILTEVRKRSRSNIGKLRKALYSQYPDRRDLPEDRFEIDVDGEVITVQRRDIEKSAERSA